MALERTAGRSLDAALACALTTFVLLVPANCLPLLSVSFAGSSRQSVLGSGVWVLWHQDWVLLATQIALFVLVLPVLCFGLLTAVLACVRLGYRPPWLGRAFRWTAMLQPWAMPDVFLLGCVVGYSRLVAFLPVRVEPGGWCLVAAALLSMVTSAVLDWRSIWRRIGPEAERPSGPSLSCRTCDLVLPLTAEGEDCPRCGRRLWARQPDSLIRTTALVCAGYILYGPANAYPMTDTYRFDGTQHHTIFSGIEELIHARLWPLAALIFCTSIAIPLLKLMGLTWLVFSVRRRAPHHLLARTRLHRFIEKIGRWSNIDVFTIAVFAPLMQFGGFVSVQAGRGADAFLLVVVVTMMASNTFDPRLMWDAAGAGDDRPG